MVFINPYPTSLQTVSCENLKDAKKSVIYILDNEGLETDEKESFLLRERSMKHRNKGRNSSADGAGGAPRSGKEGVGLREPRRPGRDDRPGFLHPEAELGSPSSSCHTEGFLSHCSAAAGAQALERRLQDQGDLGGVDVSTITLELGGQAHRAGQGGPGPGLLGCV